MPTAVTTIPQVLTETHKPHFSHKQQVYGHKAKGPQERRPQHPLKKPPQDEDYTKKALPRSGKPFINWFQRKLAGTVRTRRVRDASPVGNGHETGSNANPHFDASTTTRPNGRSVSSPLPHGVVSPQRHGTGISRRGRRTISLNDTDVNNADILFSDEDNVDALRGSYSLAQDSMWPPISVHEADEDASLRPLPPSAPPSPSFSHSSSSYLSNPRTFRSIAASTKPTTVLSIDLPPAGIGHIAQVPPTLGQSRHGLHNRSPSTSTGQVNGGSPVTFSALSPSAQSVPSGTVRGNSLNALQAPLHTTHHPRNNPRPGSPPLDNASVLTLASSAFAFPAARMTMGSVASTVLSRRAGGSDSISHRSSVAGDPEGENTSQYIFGDDDRLDVDAERVADASLRALRPRSSRRDSWDSEVSGWSARVAGIGTGNSAGTKSLWTSNSLKTGEPLGPEEEDEEVAEEPGERADQEEPKQEEQTTTDILGRETPDKCESDPSQPGAKLVENGLSHPGQTADS